PKIEILFPARCEIIYIDTSLQPVNTLALACPRKDLIRIWPLPVRNPWFEDSIIPPGKREGADEISPFGYQFSHLGRL
ncbi:MAG: hypothetical protein JW725_02245, partial [Candidatus Babeliaceae bacterium]|nr:hypothetical protein [Candidatus Babeliaceae bacterium]